MKKQIVFFALLALPLTTWATSSGTYEQDRLTSHIESYLTHGTLGGSEAIQTELREARAELQLTGKDGRKLSLEEAKMKVAQGVVLTCTFPNGRIKRIELSPAPSSEVVNAVKRTYEGPGFGAAVSVSTCK